MLQPKQKVFYVFTDKEILDVIREHFQCPDYNLNAEALESGCAYQILGVVKREMTQREEATVEAFLAGGSYPDLLVLIFTLVDAEILPEGNYLINVA